MGKAVKYFDEKGNEITKAQAEAIAKKKLIDNKIKSKDKLLFDKTIINK